MPMALQNYQTNHEHHFQRQLGQQLQSNRIRQPEQPIEPARPEFPSHRERPPIGQCFKRPICANRFPTGAPSGSPVQFTGFVQPALRQEQPGELGLPNPDERPEIGRSGRRAEGIYESAKRPESNADGHQIRTPGSSPSSQLGRSVFNCFDYGSHRDSIGHPGKLPGQHTYECHGDRHWQPGRTCLTSGRFEVMMRRAVAWTLNRCYSEPRDRGRASG